MELRLAGQPAQGPWRPRSQDGTIMDCQDRLLPPEGSLCAAGLLALDPGDGGPVEVFGARGAQHCVPLVQLSWHELEGTVS